VVEVRAEMVANVWKVTVAAGDQVPAGAELMILESMKMEIPVESPAAGTVAIVHVDKGTVVNEGDLLITLDP
jgi:acetyl-CoA carboxylase biotin carboxyl carrier protein